MDFFRAEHCALLFPKGMLPGNDSVNIAFVTDFAENEKHGGLQSLIFA
jgi:hypothetical protein